MNNNDDPLRGLSVEIHSILVAQQEPITASQLADKYEDIMGYYIDAKRYGFPNLDALLSAMTNAVCVVPNSIRNAKPKYRAVSTAETKDIESLVRRQMTKEEQMERKRTGSLPRIHLMYEIRSGEEGGEADTMFASMMWNAISASEDPNSAWNEQLKELATDLGSRQLGLFP